MLRVGEQPRWTRRERRSAVATLETPCEKDVFGLGPKNPFKCTVVYRT